MRWQIEPLASWPYKVTKTPKGNPFRASWADTLKLLEVELGHLEVIGAVAIQVVGDPADVRRDGMLRAHAKLGYRGVAISFTGKHGPLTYPCDRYAEQWYGPPDWQVNARAIALGLQALRAVDRYGVAGHGEQYAGWRAIGAGTTAPFTTGLEAIRWLISIVGPDHPSDWRALLRAASAKHHPDRGGDPEMWDRVDAARQLLEASGGGP